MPFYNFDHNSKVPLRSQDFVYAQIFPPEEEVEVEEDEEFEDEVEEEEEEDDVEIEDEDEENVVMEEDVEDEKEWEEANNGAESTSSACASQNTSLLSGLHISSTSLSYSTLSQGSSEETMSPARMLRIPQSPQRSNSSSISWSSLHESSSVKEEDNLSTLQSPANTESLKKLQKQKVNKLVNVLIRKYRMKEPITQLEMLNIVTSIWEKQFPIIFKEVSLCLEVVCGIDIKESDPISSSYVLVNSLNLTYEDVVTDDQKMPKNGLLILILGVIFIDGGCASEESIWKFLNVMGMHDGEDHFLYGEPRKFLTRDLVHQNYLEYRQVLNSHPPHFEFLWGPRAHAEASKMKVLEYMGRVTKRDPTSFSFLYTEAFRDEEERAMARMGLGGSDNTISADHLLGASASEGEELVYSAFEGNNQHSQ